MSKSAYFVLSLLAGFILESTLEVNPYILVVLMTLLFACFWHLQEQKASLEVQREHQELQVKVQSSSKDAHLKLKQLVTMVSSIPSPMMLLDQYGNIVLHNDLQSITVQPMAEEDINYLHNGYVYEVQEFIKDSYILEKSFERVIAIADIEYQALSVPVLSHGKFSGCLILFQDISKALEGEKVQKQFLADASHELKTPIAVIKGMVEILNRDDFDDPVTQRDFLKQMEQEINRLDIIVKDILILSKMSVAHPILDRRKVDLQEIIDSCIQSLRKSAQAQGVMIHTQNDLHELVFCDPMRMRQVISNLLSNAVKYGNHKDVHVHLYQAESYAVMEVKDQGSGLSEEQQAKIFDRFYRVDDDRSRKSGGSGLGLAIVKSIVDAHSGKIEILSEEGNGSVFKIYLKN